MLYLVTWEIEIEADSPEEAAVKAREIQLDPENIATHYTVDDPVSQVSVGVELGEVTVY